jgi:manganese/iron transport system substrate-binding protein
MTALRRQMRVRLGLARSSGVALLIGVLVASLAACSSDAAAPSGAEDSRVAVVTSTTVLADLVRQVGGDQVSVTSLVPKGGEVHTFDPTPSDLRAVAGADLIVMNGLGLDDWLHALVDDADASAPVVELGPDLPGVEYLTADGTPDGTVNPHLWLDVSYAARYSQRITEALADVAPDRAAAIRVGGDAYATRLADLDAWVRDQIGTIPEEDRVIVSFHEAFPYFAAAYGLTIVGTIVDAPGQDPSAGEIAGLVDAIRRSGAKAVFGEAQFSPDLVQTVADEAGVVVETDLYNDSLGDPPVDTYEGLMRWDVDRVVAALRGPA